MLQGGTQTKSLCYKEALCYKGEPRLTVYATISIRNGIRSRVSGFNGERAGGAYYFVSIFEILR